MDFYTFALAITYQTILICLLKRAYWHLLADQARYGGGAFHFSLADCWGICLGLCATVGILAYYLDDPRFCKSDGHVARLILLGYIGVTSQLAGAMLAVASNVSPVRHCRQTGEAFWQILVGSLFGLVLPAVGPILLLLHRRELTRNSREAARVKNVLQTKNQRMKMASRGARRPSV